MKRKKAPLKKIAPKQLTNSRKEKRKALSKQKKIKAALHYAKTKKTNKICINSHDLDNVKCLSSDSGLFSNLKNKVFTNKITVDLNKQTTKKKKVKKKKKKQPTSITHMDGESDDEGEAESSSFKMSDSSNLRLAKLQEYVNQESQKLKKVENGKIDKKTTASHNDNLIKDKFKLKELKLGQMADDKEIRRYAVKSKLKNPNKSTAILFDDDFAGLLEDIEVGTYSSKSKYEDEINSDSDDHFESDLHVALGKKVSDSGKSMESCVDTMAHSSINSIGSCEIGLSDNKNKVNGFREGSEEESSESEVYSSNENFLDNEAEESDCDEEADDVEIDEDREEIMFEGGTATTGLSSSMTKSSEKLIRPTMNSLFSLYSSDSEEEADTDLDGFVVDDDFVEYEDDDDDVGELPVKKKVKKPNQSRIIGKDKLQEDLNKIVDFNEPVNMPSPVKHKKRILSESSDGECIDCPRFMDNGSEKLRIEKKISSHNTLNYDLQCVNKDDKPLSDTPETQSQNGRIPRAKKRKKKNSKRAQSDSLAESVSIVEIVNESDVERIEEEREREISQKDAATFSQDTKCSWFPETPKNKLISKAKKSKWKSAEVQQSGCLAENTDSVEKCNELHVGSIETERDEEKSVDCVSTSYTDTLNKKRKKKKKDKNLKIAEMHAKIEETEDDGVCSLKAILKLSLAHTKTSKTNSCDDTTQNKVQSRKSVSFSLPVCEDEISHTKNDEYHEDIYGKLRDKTGNVIVADAMDTLAGSKYIPPAMKKLMALNSSEQKKEQLATLQRSLKGLLNRLAENNMAGIISRIEGYYQTNSRNDMNETLTKLYFDILLKHVFMSERLVQEHALLIAILSANIGPEVGGHIITEFVVKLVEELESFESMAGVAEVDSKMLDNIIFFIGQLYHFRVIDATLIYDILQKIVERPLQAKEIDLVLLVLRSIGFTLRKEDPLELKRFITRVQSRADQVVQSNVDARVRFMLEVLTAIRNNNISKVPGFDPTHSQHLKTVMRGLIRKGCHTSELNVSLQDLLKSKVVGKWWIVGSAWSGGLKEDMGFEGELTTVKTDEGVAPSILPSAYSEKLRRKAEKMHMSRPPRINILYILTEGSANYLDAFEKLVQLKLRSNQEIEIFNVMTFCCVRCKEYNMFYSLLASKLCIFKKGFRRVLEFSVWDRFKELKNLKPTQIANLAKFVADLVGEGGLNLSVFKVLSFVEADRNTVSFLRQSLIAILLHSSGTYAVSRAFNNLCSVQKLKALRQYLRLFIVKFISPKNLQGKEMKVLQSRVKMVLEILNSTGGVKL